MFVYVVALGFLNHAPISLHCLTLSFQTVGPQTEENDCSSLPETTAGPRRQGRYQSSSAHEVEQQKRELFFFTTSRNLHTQCLCTQFRLVVSRQHGRSEALVHILYVLSMCAAVSLTLFNPSTPSAPHKRRSGVCASVWPASLHVTSRLLIFM